MNKIRIFVTYVISLIYLNACTYSITMVHTEGQATDVVDETATNTPSTNISPTLEVPASSL